MIITDDLMSASRNRLITYKLIRPISTVGHDTVVPRIILLTTMSIEF